MPDKIEYLDCILCGQQIIIDDDDDIVIEHTIGNDQPIQCPMSNIKRDTYSILLENYMFFLKWMD